MKTLLKFLSGGIYAAALILLSSCTTAKFEIDYTGSLNGALHGCDCSGYPAAGLDKTALYLKSNPPENSRIILDAGNVFQTGRDAVLAELILDVYRDLGYAAVAVGINELSEGLDTLLLRSSENYTPGFLGNNLLIKNESRFIPLTPGPFIIRTDNLKTAVIALQDPKMFGPYLNLFNGKLAVADPEMILKELLENIKPDDADCVVILAHGREEWVREMLDGRRENKKDSFNLSDSAVPVAAVILAGEEKLLQENLANGIPLLSPGKYSNYLGVLNVKISRNGKIKTKNKFISFHYLNPGDPVTAEKGREYDEYFSNIRNEYVPDKEIDPLNITDNLFE
jgi:2',3'-cyclic-nucleotide 2'-phosphodiesterase (5'-nucleotidase family)